MNGRKGFWAAGVYIRESKIACVLGEVVLSHVPEIASVRVPRTDRSPEIVIAEVSCDGKRPEEALKECAEAIRDQVSALGLNLRAVHVACFGGLLSTKKSDKRLVAKPKYGVLTNVSSYPDGWEGLNIYKLFKDILYVDGMRPEIDVGTDVDAAAFGEFLYECKNLKGVALARYVRETTLVCLNFSRTINIGIVRRGELWEGESHPLLSTFRPRRFTIWSGEKNKTWFDLFEGNCPYHKDCIEGLMGVQALEERTEIPFYDIPPDHEIWELVAYYIAQTCIAVTSILMPTAIVLTGRCTRQINNRQFSEEILRRVRGHFYSRLCDEEGMFRPSYIDPDDLDPKEFIRLPRRPILKSGARAEAGLPGRHGALRLAAKEVYRLEGQLSS